MGTALFFRKFSLIGRQLPVLENYVTVITSFCLEIMLIFAILGISNVLAEAGVWGNTSSRMICDNSCDSLEHEDSSILFQLFD